MTLAVGARLQRVLPQRLLCRFIYAISRSRSAAVKAPLIAWFHRHYRVDLSEAEKPLPGDYATFNDFFTRALKPGARTIAGDPAGIVSPCDGTLTEFGVLDRGRMIQAKGMEYAVTALLDESAEAAAPFADGHYATIYLAPHDYHRVHAPVAGMLVRTRYIPGERYSVNRATASTIAGLFCRNERVVCWFDCVFGPLAVVLVGALNVSSLGTVTRGEIASGPPREWPEAPPAAFDKGAEIGRFNLGSTVIVLFPKGAIRWSTALRNGTAVSMGALLGTRNAPAAG
jgi:phosphatidylserine decarboxylase